MLFTLKVCKEEGNGGSFVSYYEEIEKITDDLKEDLFQISHPAAFQLLYLFRAGIQLFPLFLRQRFDFLNVFQMTG